MAELRVFGTPETPLHELVAPTPEMLAAAVATGADGSSGNPQMFGMAVDALCRAVPEEYYRQLFASGLPVAGRVGAEVLSPWSGGGGVVQDSNEADPVDEAAREARRETSALLPRADAALHYALQKGMVGLASWLVEQGADASRPELLSAAAMSVTPVPQSWARIPPGKAGISVDEWRDNVLPFLETHGQSVAQLGFATRALQLTHHIQLFELLVERGATLENPTNLAIEFARGYHDQLAEYRVGHGADANAVEAAIKAAEDV
jgi:hypothetical protein